MFKSYFYTVLAVLLFSTTAYSQWATPSAYTDFLGLRLYASGANAGSDSLNQNSIDIDAGVEAVNDTIVAVKTRVNTVINLGSGGGIIDGTVTWADMSTSAKATIVQVTGTQSIAGNKNFTDNMYADAIYPNDHDTYNLGKKNEAWRYIYATRFIIANTAGTDSSAISYDGETITFDKPLEITQNIVMKDSVKLSALSLSEDTWTPALTTDSVIVLDSTMSSLWISNKTFVLANIERLTMTGAGHGQVIIITNATTNNVTLEDEAPDGNLKLAGNFVMGENDTVMLKYNGNALYWFEVCRSNN